MPRAFRLLVLLLATSLAACGGGGGGGSSSPVTPAPPPPPPPPPPVVNPATPLAISGANALDVVPFGAGIPEAVYGIGVFANNHLAALAGDAGNSVDVPCDAGGLSSASNADEDGSGSLSAGDTITVRAPSGCFERLFADSASGEFTVTLNNAFRGRELNGRFDGTISLTADFQIDSADENGSPITIVVVGDIQFSFATGDGFIQAIKLWLDAGDVLEVTVGSNLANPAVERVTRFDFLRRTSPGFGLEDDFLVTFDFAIQSEILEGAIACRTTPELIGRTPATPTTGRYECSGAADSAVALVTTRASADDPISLEIDAEGDGTFEPLTTAAPLGWENVIEGQLFTEDVDRLAFLPQPVTFGTAAITTINAAVNDLVYNPVNDRLYLSNATGVVEVDPGTLDVLRSVTIADVPTRLALSDDGSTLWFGLESVPEAGRLDVTTLALGSRISLGTPSQGFPDQRIVNDLLVIAGTTDDIVITVRQSDEVIAYDNGVELPNFLPGIFGQGGATRIIQRDATMLIGANDSNSGFEVVTINYDPATGVVLDENYPGLSPGFNAPLTLGTVDIWNAQGFSFSVEPAARTGRVDGLIEQFPSFYELVKVSPGDGVAYAVGSQIVDVFDEATRARVAAYEFDGGALGSSFLSKIVDTPDELIIVSESRLGRIAKSELQPNIGLDPCGVTSVSDLLIEGTYDTLTCKLRDMVYDPGRDVIYGALPGALGPQGNSIVILDPETLGVIAYIALTAEPMTLAMSDDGAVLTATLREASQLVEIDLATRSVKRVTPLGFDTFNGTTRSDPVIATAARARPGFPDQVAVADWNNDVYIYDGGVRQDISAFARDNYSTLFFSNTDSSLLFGHLSGRLGTLRLNGSGVDFLNTTENVLSGIPLARQDNRLLSGSGEELDLGTLVGSQGCDFGNPGFAQRAVAYSGAADTAFFAQPDFGRHLLYRCSLATGQVNPAKRISLYNEGTTGRPFALYELNSGELVYLHEGTLMKLSAPE